jgi:hypothetical protein
MLGPFPEELEAVEARARRFPDGWKDAAIRLLFDPGIGGVMCPGCNIPQVGRAMMRRMQGDHILPWSRGGLTVWENLQLLCPPCNWTKNNSMP